MVYMYLENGVWVFFHIEATHIVKMLSRKP